MNFPILLAGLVLLLAGQSWFSGAGTVGWVLITVGGIITIIQAVVFVWAGTKINKGRRSLAKSTRGRRGF